MSGSVLGELVLRSAIPVAIATSPSSIALTGNQFMLLSGESITVLRLVGSKELP